MSVKRTSKRDQVLRGLMSEAYHRALMAFPDEDVVVGCRFVNADSVVALKDLDDLTPRPRQRRRGEERAWGRRLAKRFGIDGKYDAKSFISKAGAQDGFLDFESAKPEKLDPMSSRCSMLCRSTRAASWWSMAGPWPKTCRSSASAERVHARCSLAADDSGVLD